MSPRCDGCAICTDGGPLCLAWDPVCASQVLLVDQSDRFVFKPLLYELLTKGVPWAL